MNYRKLGDTGLLVSELAFGGVEIGMPYGLGVEAVPDRKDSIALLRTAHEAGINFIDTARGYGQSEEIIGEAFWGLRDRVVLCTKCSHFKKGGAQIPPSTELRKFVRSSLARSLEALQTDYVDLYMLHQGDLDILKNDDVLRIFQDIQSDGYARAIGVSVYHPEETAQAVSSGIWNVIQIPFNLMDQRQAIYFDEAEKKGIGLVVRSVLLRGLLSDRSTTLHPELNAIAHHIRRYDELLTEDITDLPSLATKFALSFKQVSSVLVGIDKKEYLDRAITAVNAPVLTEYLQRRGAELAYSNPEFIDLHKWSQNGWI